MIITKSITICDDRRNFNIEVELDVDADDMRCAIREGKDSESTVLSSFSDFIRWYQAVPDEIYTGFNDKQREIIGMHLEQVLAKVRAGGGA